MVQIIFAWVHKGQSVSIAGTFNNWQPTPLTKQGRKFFVTLDLEPAVHSYKYVVDGRWVYDLIEESEDDGSGNWNNILDLTSGASHGQKGQQQGKKEQHQNQQQGKGKQQNQEQNQQQGKGKQQNQNQDQQQGKGKQQNQQQGKGKQNQEENQEENKQQQGKGKQNQQQGKGKQQPQKSPAPAHEAEDEAEHEEQTEKPAETPKDSGKPEKPASTSIITIDIVASDVDADMGKLEEWIRSHKVDGLKWEGSSIGEHFFGLKKLVIICSARDDVAIEDLCRTFEENEELVGSAQIQSFAC